MLIGLPKEIKDNESRVGLTPGAVRALTRRGHRVLIESGAGLGSSVPDDEYRAAGGEIVPSRRLRSAGDQRQTRHHR